MTDFTGDRLADLGDGLSDAEAVTARFTAELDRMRDSVAATDRDGAALARTFGTGVRRAIDGVVRDGRSLSDALRGVGRSFANTTYRSATGPVATAAGGALSRLPGFDALLGGGLAAGDARTIRTRPTVGGTVASGPAVNINVTTPDVAGFNRSRSQIAAEMSRALARGRRNA